MVEDSPPVGDAQPTVTLQDLMAVMNAIRHEQTGLVQRVEDQHRRLERHEEFLQHLEQRADRGRERHEQVRQEQEQMHHRVQELQAMPAGLKIPKPSQVNGKNAKKLRDFFGYFKTYCASVGLSERDPRAVALAGMYFTPGSPLNQWWTTRQQHMASASPELQRTAGFQSISELETAVLTQFTVRKPADEARDKLATARQKGTVSEYVTTIRSYLVHVPDRSDADNLHMFKRGLKPQLGQALAVRDPKSFDEAIAVAVEIEASMSHVDTRRRPAAAGVVQLHGLNGDDHSDHSENETESESESDGARDCPKREKAKRGRKRGGRGRKKTPEN